MKLPAPRLLLATAALFAALPALPADEAPPPPEGARREKMRENAGRMADELGLTADQRAKWKELAEQERAEMDAIRADTSLSKEDRRAKGGEVRKHYMDLRQAVLTPEQRTKADELRKQWRKDHGPGDKPADGK